MYYIVITDNGGGRFADIAKTLKEAEFTLSFYQKKGAREGAIHKEPFYTTVDEDSLVSFFAEKGCYWDNVAKDNPSINNKRALENPNH